MSDIIDNNNKFIQITLNYEPNKLDKNKNLKFNWIDSYRIFPVSLENLCNNFNVNGKISKYNEKFNNIELFSDNSLVSEFKQYALQDSICLLNALNKAQKIYAENNNVDITSILSTSTLSFKSEETAAL